MCQNFADAQVLNSALLGQIRMKIDQISNNHSRNPWKQASK